MIFVKSFFITCCIALSLARPLDQEGENVTTEKVTSAKPPTTEEKEAIINNNQVSWPMPDKEKNSSPVRVKINLPGQEWKRVHVLPHPDKDPMMFHGPTGQMVPTTARPHRPVRIEIKQHTAGATAMDNLHEILFPVDRKNQPNGLTEKERGPKPGNSKPSTGQLAKRIFKAFLRALLEELERERRNFIGLRSRK